MPLESTRPTIQFVAQYPALCIYLSSHLTIQSNMLLWNSPNLCTQIPSNMLESDRVKSQMTSAGASLACLSLLRRKRKCCNVNFDILPW
jgi:hypothetical protein